MKIVVVGPNCWGAGDSLRQAVGKARINWPRWAGRNYEAGMPYNAYEASDDFEVDPFGAISASSLKRIREVRIVDGKRVVREGANILGD